MQNPELKKTKCSHHCTDNAEGYLCSCDDGYILENDLKTCKFTQSESVIEETEDLEIDKDEDEENLEKEREEEEELQEETDEAESIVECTEEDILRCKPGKCISENSDVRCDCPDGFLEKSKSCHDLDECQYGTHECSHNCHNLYGNYECSCPPGLKIMTDGKTCDDVDECEFGVDGICGQLVCRNTYGSYKCVCPDEKEMNEHGHCVETNLCGEDNGGE